MNGNDSRFFIYVNVETLQLKPDDVRRAVELFIARFGRRPRALGLHQDCGSEIKAAAEEVGIPVHHPPGMLAHEIWLSPWDGFVTPSSTMGPRQFQIGEERNKTQTRPPARVGRPPAPLPVKRLLALRSQGLGAREIAKRLEQEGLRVSHMTVHRALARAVGEKGLREE